MKSEATRSCLEVRRIAPSASAQWTFDATGCLAHRSGRFFRVIGVEHRTPLEGGTHLQPLIDQPEVGDLCFLVVEDGEGWWVLAQAKVEPGNVDGAQLAPSVQATRSNYEAAHGGKSVPYHGLTLDGSRALYDQLQSEHNGRFLRKRNRNSVIRLDERTAPFDTSFRWLSMAEFLPLLLEDNLVNTDARSVLTCWLLTHARVLEGVVESGSLLQDLILALDAPLDEKRRAELESWLGRLASRWFELPRECGLEQLQPDWAWRDGIFQSALDPTVLVHHVAVRCQTREVYEWDQPLLGTRTLGQSVSVMGRIGGELHLLVQARAEAGNHSGFEVTTAIQAESTETMTEAERSYAQVLRSQARRVFEFKNSEEGGRFDRCVTSYGLFWTDSPQDVPEGPLHRWVPMAQLAAWARQPNRLTNELRSALSALFAIRE